VKFFAKLRRLFSRRQTGQDIGETLPTLDRPFPVLEDLDPCSTDREAATKLLTLAGFVATLIDRAGSQIGEDVRACGRVVVKFATSQAAAAKLDMTEWADAVWRGREVLLAGPDDECLALLAAAEVLLLDTPPQEPTGFLADGLLAHFRGLLNEEAVRRFIEFRVAARELSGLQMVRSVVVIGSLLSRMPSSPFDVEEPDSNGRKGDGDEPEPLWPDLFPWQERAGVA